MKNIFKNLQRRNVFKAAISYAVFSWLILQVAAIVFPILEINEGAMRFLLIFLIIGFPCWVTFAYFFERTASGFKRTTDADIDLPVDVAISRRSNALIIAGLSLTVLLLLTDRIFNLSGGFSTASIDKSIAVLPFANLSSDPDQEYFSDGLTDDILTQLAKIEDFKVISRTSVMQYKVDPPPVKEIAKQLNVSLILEGSVQKMGDEVRITAQLINAITDEHLWADSYDRPVDDLFSIQREVATSIAGVLKTTISPEETQMLETVPTKNIVAYQEFQQGKYYLHQPHFDSDAWAKAIAHFENAVTLDPEFAEAFGLLAKAHSRLYYLRRDHTSERLEQASEAAAKSLELGPDNPNVLLNFGYYQLWANSDKPTALAYFEQASPGLPNSVAVLRARASIYESLGQFDKYIEVYRQAVDISPLDASCWTSLTFGYEFTYQFKEGLESVEKALALDPEANWNHLAKAFIMFSYKGADDETRKILNRVRASHSWYPWAQFHQEMFEGNIDAGYWLVENHPNGVDSKMAKIPQPLLKAYLLSADGKLDSAKVEFAKSLEMLSAEIEGKEDDDRYHSALGLSHAGLGNKDQAILHGKKAIDLMPLSKEAIYGIPSHLDMALIYSMIEEPDLAFDHLEMVLQGPSYWTVKWLEKDFRYDALRDHPRYKSILEKYARTLETPSPVLVR